MNRLKTKNHDFHFIMDQVMLDKLRTLAILRDSPGLSGMIVRILQMLYPRLEKEHFSGRQRESQYQFVNVNKDLQRCNIHVYLPRSLYRRLKLMHQDLDFYSIGQLIRWMLNLFLEMVNKYGGDIKRKIKYYLHRWRNQNNKYCFTAQKLRQLLKQIDLDTGKIRLINIYSMQYAPIHIFRC